MIHIISHHSAEPVLIITDSTASAYLPSDVVTTDEGNLKPPPPVSCFLGPFGKQIQVEMEMFQSHKMGMVFVLALLIQSHLHHQSISFREAKAISSMQAPQYGVSIGVPFTPMTVQVYISRYHSPVAIRFIFQSHSEIIQTISRYRSVSHPRSLSRNRSKGRSPFLCMYPDMVIGPV